MPSVIKVLVVDDSALVRHILKRALAQDPRIQVVGAAKDGLEAIELCKQLHPDVVTLDIEMPSLSGLETLPFITRETDARVIMLSSVDDPETTYEALAGGAIDFIPKPKGGFALSITDLTEVLLKKIKTAYRVSPDRREAAAPGSLVGNLLEQRTAAPQPRPALPSRASANAERVVALAASTGGPPALERVFSGLRADLPTAYVVVQHLPAGFTDSLVDRLRRVTDIRVIPGADNMTVETGVAYVAPHGYHMTVTLAAGWKTRRLSLVEGPSVHGVKPAADPLIESVADVYGDKTVGVLLTGMGSDGVDGLESVVAAGGATIVQDERSSVVWGMPGSAVRRGVAQHVVPLEQVSTEICRAVREGS
jgi:two-component system chemotaxis response regulator CheB